MTLFDQGAQSTFRDPGGVGVVAVPRVEDGKGFVRVIFGDVVEVIRDGLAHIEAGIGAQVFEDGQGGRGIGDEFDEAEGPREAGATAFARETADVFVGIVLPFVHDREGAMEIALEELADREFGRAEGREKF